MIKYLIGISIIIYSLSISAEFDFSSVEDVEKSSIENKAKKDLAKQKQTEAKAAARHKHKINVYREKKAREAVVYDDKRRDKNRQQAYEDELRSLEIQALKARVKRTDDYINAELAREVATTDSIQSGADRTRMKGQAEIIRAENPQDITVVIAKDN